MRRQRLPLFVLPVSRMRLTVLHMAFATGSDFFGGRGRISRPERTICRILKTKRPEGKAFSGVFFVKTTYGVCALKDMPTAANAGNQAYALFFRSCRYGLFLGGDFAFGFVIDRVLFGAFLGLFLGFRRLRSDIIRIKRGSD